MTTLHFVLTITIITLQQALNSYTDLLCLLMLKKVTETLNDNDVKFV
jgi:hypothetical protein